MKPDAVPVTRIAHARARALRPALSLLMLCVVLIRLPALLSPKAIDDEQVYAVVAREMLQGGQPYRDAIEGKPPLLFELYREIFAIAGASNWFALHLVAIVWTGCTMLILSIIAHRLWGCAAGLWADVLYGLFAAWGDYRDLAFNGELLMNLPIVLAIAMTF